MTIQTSAPSAPGELALSAEAQDLLFREARTANTFTDEPVSEEQVRAIYELTKWGPTAMNSQPLRVVFVRSREARERLVQNMSGSNSAKTLTAPLVAILGTDTDFHDNLDKVFPVYPGAREMFAADDAQREQSARLSASLQIGYFIIAVRAAGLAAGPMAGFDADAVTKEFFPGGKQRALVVVNIGRPGEAAWHDRLPRLDYDEVVRTV